MNPFEAYSKKALSNAPARLLGPTKTRAEATQIYTGLVGELRACRDLAALRTLLAASEPTILQIHAELEFLWFGDGQDFLGLNREIEDAFEAVEAAQYFKRFRNDPKCEAGRLPGQSESQNRT